MFEPFRNEPYSDFSLSENAAAYREALAAVRARLGDHHPLVIGGERVDTADRIESANPCRPAEIVGTTGSATPENALAALEAAWKAFDSWSRLPAEARGRAVARLAAVLRRHKLELSAWETFEAAKNWSEAEADVAEAIDFCEYYARQSMTMAEPLPAVPYPGEDNRSHLVPIGAGVVIPPWNFPLAILAGMAVGPVAAGNTVVIKPASATPVIGAVFMEAVEEAGIPPGGDQLRPRAGRRDRRHSGRSPDDQVRQFHRVAGGRGQDRRARGRCPPRAALAEARLHGDGWQGRPDRRRDSRPRCSERGRRDRCFWLPGAEVLGLLPADPGG